ncbi:MAG: pectin acetylesterase-family hydrolase [Nannocystaceae bacterium]
MNTRFVGGRRAALGLGLLAASAGACAGDDAATASASAGSTSSTAAATETAGDDETTTTTTTTTTGDASTSAASGTMSGGETTGTTGPAEPYCGDGVVDRDEACDDGNADDFDGCRSDCTAVAPLDPPAMEWKYYEIEGTKCLDGSPAGFGVSHNPASKDLMIYLEGGGACFSDACDFTAFSIPFVPPVDGIFSRSNDNNPVRDWTMVYVPYCSGDIHGGDKETELGGQLRYFHGYRNVTRYLEVLIPSFPVDRVLLTGISAGGFGAALNASQVAEAYGAGVELTVVDDSGPPLSNEVIAPCLQTIFRETWGLDGTVLVDCPECDGDNFASDLLDHVITTYPDVRFGLFSNTGDQIIRSYMGAGWGGGDYNNCEGVGLPVPIAAYADDLDALRAAYEGVISTFYLTGLGHTVLRVGYNITSVKGTSVPEWVGQVLAGDITHVGP